MKGTGQKKKKAKYRNTGEKLCSGWYQSYNGFSVLGTVGINRTMNVCTSVRFCTKVNPLYQIYFPSLLKA